MRHVSRLWWSFLRETSTRNPRPHHGWAIKKIIRRPMIMKMSSGRRWWCWWRTWQMIPPSREWSWIRLSRGWDRPWGTRMKGYLHKITPNYKNTRLLAQFVSSYTGRVYGKHITGLCTKQQRNVESAITISRSCGMHFSNIN